MMLSDELAPLIGLTTTQIPASQRRLDNILETVKAASNTGSSSSTGSQDAVEDEASSSTTGNKAGGNDTVSRQHQESTTAASDCDSDSSTFPLQLIRAMSLAEDRAGFSVQVLASRKDARASLSLSDAHKATGNQLVTLMKTVSTSSGTTTDDNTSNSDPRAKVYDVKQLLANPISITDKSTGLSVPTISLIEMNCVREELAPFDSSTNNDSSAHLNNAALFELSQLITIHAYDAFTFGYPSVDYAVFEE